MPDLTIWISGADFINIKSFFAPEGRRLFEIRSFFCPGRVDFSQTFLAGVGLRSATLAANKTWGWTASEHETLGKPRNSLVF